MDLNIWPHPEKQRIILKRPEIRDGFPTRGIFSFAYDTAPLKVLLLA